MDDRVIKIKCRSAEMLTIDRFEPFQGKLKNLTKDNYSRLKKQILDLGFSEPIGIWKDGDHNYILSGHQRYRTILQMVAEGYQCDSLPVSIIEADSYKQAKLKVLSLAGQYGDLDDDGLYEFAVENEIQPVDLMAGYRFVSGEYDVEKFVHSFFLDGEKEKKEKARKPITCPSCGHLF